MGYDVFEADIWSTKSIDPGVKDNIFAITCNPNTAGKQTTEGIRDFVTILDTTDCTGEKKTVSSYEQYYDEYYSSNEFEYAAEVRI